MATNSVGKGNGQGLAIAQSVIVKKHRGAIRFDTAVGVGTTFVFQLPLSGAVEKA
jgi:signal transduction histidine kinase